MPIKILLRFIEIVTLLYDLQEWRLIEVKGIALGLTASLWKNHT